MPLWTFFSAKILAIMLSLEKNGSLRFWEISLSDPGNNLIHSKLMDGDLIDCQLPCEPRKKTLTTFHYTGWVIGISTMGKNKPFNKG